MNSRMVVVVVGPALIGTRSFRYPSGCLFSSTQNGHPKTDGFPTWQGSWVLQNSEMGRIRFRRVRFQTPNSVVGPSLISGVVAWPSRLRGDWRSWSRSIGFRAANVAAASTVEPWVLLATRPGTLPPHSQRSLFFQKSLGVHKPWPSNPCFFRFPCFFFFSFCGCHCFFVRFSLLSRDF